MQIGSHGKQPVERDAVRLAPCEPALRVPLAVMLSAERDDVVLVVRFGLGGSSHADVSDVVRVRVGGFAHEAAEVLSDP
jgi:hypothetical protein